MNPVTIFWIIFWKKSNSLLTPWYWKYNRHFGRKSSLSAEKNQCESHFLPFSAYGAHNVRNRICKMLTVQPPTNVKLSSEVPLNEIQGVYLQKFSAEIFRENRNYSRFKKFNQSGLQLNELNRFFISNLLKVENRRWKSWLKKFSLWFWKKMNKYKIESYIFQILNTYRSSGLCCREPKPKSEKWNFSRTVICW